MGNSLEIINCPVCSYQDIQGNTCPNCDADITLIRTLKNLPIVEESTIIVASKFSKPNLFLVILLCVFFGFLSGIWFIYWSFGGAQNFAFLETSESAITPDI